MTTRSLRRRFIYLPLPAVGIIGRFADRVVCDHVVNEVFVARVNHLMRFVRSEDESIAGYDLNSTVFMANSPFARNNQIQFPLGRVRMIGEIGFSRRHATPFQIERMSFGQIERGRLAPKRFGNSLERDGVLSARRAPWVFVDLVDVYFSHDSRFIAEVAEFTQKT